METCAGGGGLGSASLCFASSPPKTCKPDTWTLQALIYLCTNNCRTCLCNTVLVRYCSNDSRGLIFAEIQHHAPSSSSTPCYGIPVSPRFICFINVSLGKCTRSCTGDAQERPYHTAQISLIAVGWTFRAKRMRRKLKRIWWCCSMHKPEHPCYAERKKDKAAILSHG